VRLEFCLLFLKLAIFRNQINAVSGRQDWFKENFKISREERLVLLYDLFSMFKQSLPVRERESVDVTTFGTAAHEIFSKLTFTRKLKGLGDFSFSHILNYVLFRDKLKKYNLNLQAKKDSPL